MLKAIGNVAPRHLLDLRLHPPAELARSVTASPAQGLKPNAQSPEPEA